MRKWVGSQSHEWVLRYRFAVTGKEFDAQTLDVRDAFTHLEPDDFPDVYCLPGAPSAPITGRRRIPVPGQPA